MVDNSGEFTRLTPAVCRLAAIVVTYNRKDQLVRTVSRLLDEGVDHVLVVDNASTDGTRAWLERQKDARLQIVWNDRNEGGAGGFEKGLRAAHALFDPDWFVLMDDDARPHLGAIEMFRSLLGQQEARRAQKPQAPRWAAFAGGVYYPDGTICETNRPSKNPFWDARRFIRTLFGAGRAGFHVSDADYTAAEPAQIDVASFVGLFLSREAIRIAGYPDGKLFIYGDDVLYSIALRTAGGCIGFAPSLAFEHDCSTFDGGAARIHRPLWKVYYTYRNGLMAYRKLAGPVFFWPVLLICLPKWAMKVRAYRQGERRMFLRLLCLAVQDGVCGRMERAFEDIQALAHQCDTVERHRAGRGHVTEG